MCVFKILSYISPSWWRELIVPPSLTFVVITTYNNAVRIKYISKKLVAATGGVYVFKHYYNLAIASGTAGTLCPAAIYAVYTIYNTTNNAAPIKYLPQKISPTNIPTPKRFPILYIRNRDVARRFCEVLPVPNRAKKKSLISFLSTGRVTPIFVYIEYVLLPTTEIINYLSQKLLQYIFAHHCLCFKKFFQLFSLMAAGHRCVLRHNVCQPLRSPYRNC